MLITDDFIMLNIPKTASTFARDVIKKIYRGEKETKLVKGMRKFGVELSPVKELLLPNIKKSYSNAVDQHGIYDQIPKKYLQTNRQIISVIRNPFSAWVSRYTFESWKKNQFPERVLENKKHFPNYPNLSFEEYLECMKLEKKYILQGLELKPGVELSGTSIQFLQIFCKNHKEAIQNIDHDFMENGFYEKYFPNVKFLKTENINQDLYDYLLTVGFRKKEINWVLSEEKVRVSNKKPWQEFITSESKQQIIENEWLFFKLFPEYLETV